MTLYKGEKMVCPACESELEDNIESYVIPGLQGANSIVEEICPECDACFSVEYLGDEEYDVVEQEYTEEEE